MSGVKPDLEILSTAIAAEFWPRSAIHVMHWIDGDLEIESLEQWC